MFKDRSDAGTRLAARLQHLAGEATVVLALPRGGVVVAYEIAQTLKAPLDVVLVRKLGAPGQPELAAGAIVESEKPETVTNPEIVCALSIKKTFLDREADRQREEIGKRRASYRGGKPRLSVRGQTAIVVDDGIATGATMRAALRAIGRETPARLVLAVPVAPPETIARLEREVDEAVCLEQPFNLGAIGHYYADFSQTSDAEVIDLLKRANTA
ncbi:MAG: phosphoribosyltransferase [Alphaproteobacteria bacterium]|nr:phosphoribosyltransferase [Alphaproteobacteria bacterium]